MEFVISNALNTSTVHERRGDKNKGEFHIPSCPVFKFPEVLRVGADSSKNSLNPALHSFYPQGQQKLLSPKFVAIGSGSGQLASVIIWGNTVWCISLAFSAKSFDFTQVALINYALQLPSKRKILP